MNSQMQCQRETGCGEGAQRTPALYTSSETSRELPGSTAVARELGKT